MMSEIETLLREPRAVQIGGRHYALRPLTVRAVPVISRCIGPLWDELAQRPDLLANQSALTGWMLLRLPALIESRLDDLLQLLGMITGEQPDTLAELPLEDFVELLIAAHGDVRDFFTRTLLPRLKAAANGDGATLSTPSSPPATAAIN